MFIDVLSVVHGGENVKKTIENSNDCQRFEIMVR